jgi:translation elongation factor EF-Tu-like GTPase
LLATMHGYIAKKYDRIDIAPKEKTRGITKKK